MKVLNLVTTRTPFFEQQEAILAEKGVEATTVAVPGEWDPETDSSRSPLDYVRFYRDVLAARPWQYDLVHANYGLTAPAALAAPCRPVVLSLWGSDLHGRFGLACRAFARACDEVIVMTAGMAERLGRDCHVVPHGVDLEQFQPVDREAAREAVGWPTDRLQILFPYDPDRAVKNYPLAEDVATAAAGRVDEPVDLRTLSGVDHERMVEYLNAADVVLLTSRREGSPNVVKEALACNVPVVARDVGDVGFRLAGVSPSAACRSRDALVDALVSVLRTDRRSNGRSSVAELSTARTAERIERVYHRALGTDDGSEAGQYADETSTTGRDADERSIATGSDSD